MSETKPATTINIGQIKPYPHFSEFSNTPKVLDGTKIKIDEVIDKEILILAFRRGASRYKTKEYATVQFTYPGHDPDVKHIFFTGSHHEKFGIGCRCR